MNRKKYNLNQTAVRSTAIEDILISGEEPNHGP
jgi:hypothetical protein